MLRVNHLEAVSCNLVNDSAEKAVLGILIRFPETLSRADELREADFCLENARFVLRAVQELRAENAAIDFITVSERAGAYGPAAADFAIECMQGTPCGANVDEYVNIVRELGRRRELVDLANRLRAQACDRAKNVAGVADGTRESLDGLEKDAHAAMPIGAALTNTYEFLSRLYEGLEKPVMTGVAELDALTGGMFPGEMTVIGARPGVGKSAFGMHIALHAARAGASVCVCSREMTDVQYGQRLLARISGLDGMALRTGRLSDGDWPRLDDAMTELGALPLKFLFGVSAVEDLRAQARRLKGAGALDVLVVDYLQLLQTAQRFQEEYLRVGHVSKALKAIALDLHIVVIALAQVGRSAQGKMPTMAELRSSGEIEQDADSILFLHRPEEAGDASVHPSDRPFFADYAQKGLQYTAVSVAKQRQGHTGLTRLLFDPAHMSYSAVERERR